MPEPTTPGNPGDQQDALEGMIKNGDEWVYQYQPKDRDGNTIGPEMKYTGKTKNEVFQKIAAGKLEADRTIHRIRNQRPTPVQQQPTINPQDEFNLGLEVLDPKTAVKAIRRIQETDPVLLAERQKATFARVTYEFLTKNGNDFYNCDANGKILTDWLAANGYEYSVPNLEIALDTCRSRLAEAPRARTPVVTPQIPETPVTPQRRSAPDVMPGGFSGVPLSATGGLTKKIIGSWSTEEFLHQTRDPQRKEEILRIVNS